MAQHFQPAHLRHPVIADDQIGAALLKARQCLLAILGNTQLGTGQDSPHHPMQKIPHIGVVLHQNDPQPFTRNLPGRTGRRLRMCDGLRQCTPLHCRFPPDRLTYAAGMVYLCYHLE